MTPEFLRLIVTVQTTQPHSTFLNFFLVTPSQRSTFRLKPCQIIPWLPNITHTVQFLCFYPRPPHLRPHARDTVILREKHLLCSYCMPHHQTQDLRFKEGWDLVFLKDCYTPGTLLDVFTQYLQKPWQVIIICNLQVQQWSSERLTAWLTDGWADLKSLFFL